MNYNQLLFAAITILSIVFAPVLYIWRSFVRRVEVLEEQMATKVTEDEVRTVLKDKLEPLHDDVDALNSKLDKILDYLIKK